MRNALLIILVTTFAAASLLAVRSLVARAQSAAVPSEQLGLSKTSVFETPAPPATLTNTTDPGDQPAVKPDFPDQPPVVPHGVLDFLPIVEGDNMCLDCHLVEEKVPGEATPVPPSHFIDFRKAPGTRGDEVVGARYVCVSCHVSPGENAPLVKNTFAQPPGSTQ